MKTKYVSYINNLLSYFTKYVSCFRYQLDFRY